MRLAGLVLALALLSRPAAAVEKRALPDYDGRGPGPGDGAWWAPRIALFPLWLVSEYVLRQPIRAAVRPFDRNAAEAGDNARDRWDLRPILQFDVGFRPRVGALVVGNDAFTTWRFRADTWGPASFGLASSAAAEVGRSSFEVYTDLSRRPDTLFHGLGPRSTPDARVRVPLDRGETGGRFTAAPHPALLFATAIAVRGARFHVPVERDYVAFVQRIALTVDARPIREVGLSVPKELARGDGVRLELDAEHAGAPLPNRRWLAWGGRIRARLELYRGRLLEAAATARFVDPLGTGDPPYLEQATLGGDQPLRGHLAGRLFGRSALAMGISYRWPVWVFLDGFVTVETGNVFGAHLRDATPRLFRLSAVTGIRNTSTSGYVFEILGGFGTEPIADGARVSSGRLLFSATRAL